MSRPNLRSGRGAVATLWLARPTKITVHEPDRTAIELPPVFADATIDLER